MATDMPNVQFRPGRDLLVELEARGPSIHLVAKRMCERYLALVQANIPTTFLRQALMYWEEWSQENKAEYQRTLDLNEEYNYYHWTPLTSEALTDALERAHILVERDGFAITEALVAVGLVQKGTDNG